VVGFLKKSELLNTFIFRGLNMNIKYLFALHEWQKLGGPRNISGGKFEQKYICNRCKKIKRETC